MFSRVFEESDNKKYHLVKLGKSVAIKKSLKSWKIQKTFIYRALYIFIARFSLLFP